MATLALTAVAGSAFSGLLASVAGSLVGFLVQRLFAGKPDVQKPELPDLSVQSATFGAPLPNAWGTVRLAGNVIWARDIIVQEEEIEAGKGGSSTVGIQYHFFGTFSVAFCLGPSDGGGVVGIRRLWADSNLIYDQGDSVTPQAVLGSIDLADSITFHLGTATQEASALQEQFEGSGNVPAYRNVVYVDIEMLQLDEYGSRLPSISAEIAVTSADSYLVEPPWTDRPSATGNENGNIRFVDGVHYFGEIGSDNPATSVTLKRQAWTMEGLQIAESDFVYEGASGLIGVSGYVENTGAMSESLVYAYGPQTGVYGLWEGTTFLGQTLDTGASPVILTGLARLVYSAAQGAIYGHKFGGSTLYKWAASENQNTGQLTITLQATAEYASGAGNGIEGVFPDPANSGRVWITVDMGSGNDEIRLLASDLTLSDTFELDTALRITDRTGMLYDEQTDRFIVGGGTFRNYAVFDVDLGAATATLVEAGETSLGPSGLTDTYPPMPVGTRMLLVWAQYVSVGQLDQGTVPLSEIIDDVAALAGMEAADVDTSAVTEVLGGFFMPRPMAAKSALEGLLQGFQVDSFESDHLLKFQSRTASAVVATLTSDDLGAAPPDGEAPDIIMIERRQDDELMRQVTVRHRDPAAKHEIGAQVFQRITGNSANDAVIDLPAVLSVDLAAQMAERLVLSDWSERHLVRFVTDIGKIGFDPADRVTVDGRTGRLVQVDTDWETMTVECRMVQDETSVYTPTAGGDPAPDDDDSVPFAGAVLLRLLDIPPMRDVDDLFAFYWAAGAVYSTWPGCALYQSRDGGGSWANIGAVDSSSVVGTAETALADGPLGFEWGMADWSGGAGGQPWDAIETVDVLLASTGTLGNASQPEVLAGANTAILGDEVIGWETVTLLSAGRYRLSSILRGRRGTEPARLTHAVGDRFVVLTTSETRNHKHGADDISTEFSYRAPAFGQPLTSAPSQEFSNTGIRQRPFSPVGLAYSTPATGSWDIDVTWYRRSRLGDEYRDFATDAPPLDAAAEAYEAEVWDAGETVLKRTKTGLSSEALTYAEAEQNQDFGFRGAPFHLKVFQTNSDYPASRGTPGELDVAGWDAFDPGTDIASANLICWLDASDATYRTDVSTKISQLDDRSGNANHATQGTDASRPTIASAAYTSQDGTTTRDAATWATSAGTENIFLQVADSVDFDAPDTNDQITVAVAANPAASPGYGRPTIVNKGNSAFTGADISWGMRVDPDDLIWYIDDDTDESRVTSVSKDTMQIFIGEMRSTSLERRIHVDGTLEDADSDVGGITDVAHPLQIGAAGETAGTAEHCWHGDIGEILVFDAALTDAERASLTDYLRWKWGAGPLDTTTPPVAGDGDAAITASEAIAAGELVNVWNDAGQVKVRLADSSTAQRAHGFAPDAIALGALGEITFTSGLITGLAGLVAGTEYALGLAGAVTATIPTTAGHLYQPVGVAISATEMAFRVGVTMERG